MIDDTVRAAFNNDLFPFWEQAMDRFFVAVDERRRKDGLSDEQVAEALTVGYCLEVADAWNDWVGADQ